jgi:hypothetical protein
MNLRRTKQEGREFKGSRVECTSSQRCLAIVAYLDRCWRSRQVNGQVPISVSFDPWLGVELGIRGSSSSADVR